MSPTSWARSDRRVGCWHVVVRGRGKELPGSDQPVSPHTTDARPSTQVGTRILGLHGRLLWLHAAWDRVNCLVLAAYCLLLAACCLLGKGLEQAFHIMHIVVDRWRDADPVGGNANAHARGFELLSDRARVLVAERHDRWCAVEGGLGASAGSCAPRLPNAVLAAKPPKLVNRSRRLSPMLRLRGQLDGCQLRPRDESLS
jgi:hypothetical protein